MDRGRDGERDGRMDRGKEGWLEGWMDDIQACQAYFFLSKPDISCKDMNLH